MIPRCPAGHPMPRYEAFVCDGGHEHRVHTCGARVGASACGAARTIPEPGPGCDEDEDDRP